MELTDRHKLENEYCNLVRGLDNVSEEQHQEDDFLEDPGNVVIVTESLLYLLRFHLVRVGATTHGPPKRDASSRQFYHPPS